MAPIALDLALLAQLAAHTDWARRGALPLAAAGAIVAFVLGPLVLLVAVVRQTWRRAGLA